MYIDNMGKLPDDSLIDFWVESECDKYAAAIAARYLPFLYGVSLFVCRDASHARENLHAFITCFTSVLSSYDKKSDFTLWLYAAFLGFLRERDPAIPERVGGVRLTGNQQAFLRKLAQNDRQAVSEYESALDRLPKPQKECMRLFLFRHETFEGIARRTGYLTDKIRNHIESGIALLCTGEDTPDHEVTGFKPMEILPAYLNYLKGNREDSSAYGIELASISDPFLADAVEGCLVVDGDHAANVAELGREFGTVYYRPHSNRIWIYVLIASLAVIAGVFVYLHTPTQRQQQPAATQPVLHEPLPESIENQHESAVEGQPESEPVDATGTSTGDTLSGEDALEKPVAENEKKHNTGIVSLISVSMDTDDDVSHYTSLPKIGWRAYDDYLDKAAVELDDDVSGDVTVTFNVNRYGRPSQIRITEYLTPEAHREAIRLLDIGPEWSPTDKRVTIVLRFK